MKKFKTMIMVLSVSLLIFGYGCSKSPKNPVGPVFSSNAKVLFTLDQSDNKIYAYDLNNDTVLQKYYYIGQWGAGLKYDDGYLYAVSTKDNNLKIINTLSGYQHLVDLGAGNSPDYIAFDNNDIFVTLNTDSSVAVISKSGYTVSKIKVGAAPWGIFYYNGYLYVANTGYISYGNYGQGTVSVIDVSNDSIIKTINVGTNPQQFAYSAGYIVLVCAGNYGSVSGEIDIIDPVTNSLKDTAVVQGAATVIASVNPSAVLVAISSWLEPTTKVTEVYEVSIPSLSMTKKLDLSAGDIIMDSSGDTIYISSGYSSAGPGHIWEIRASDYTVSDTVNIGQSPTALALTEQN